MTSLSEPTPLVALDLKSPDSYFNRELSWLEFNRRVLHEALDPRTPLLERLKFTAIFSSNLDEFFMVRVSGLKEQVTAEVHGLTVDGLTPPQELAAISDRLRPMVTEQHQHFEQVLRPALRAYGVYLLDYPELTSPQRQHLQTYFEQRIFPILTPLAVDPSHPFPHISNLSLNLAVVLKDPVTDVEHFARVKVPSSLPRFLPLPPEFAQPGLVWVGVPLEQVIAHNLEALFPGMTIQEYYCFRVTRDADFELRDDEADDLLLAIEEMLRKRRLGEGAVRLEIQATMPETVRCSLMEPLNLTPEDIYPVEGLLNLKDLMAFLSLPLPDLKDSPWTPVVPPRLTSLGELKLDNSLEDGESFFALIRRGDLLVHHPYECFTASVERFILQAANDRQVLAIKMTLYRTSGDSPIVQALIAAAERGKQVAVLVELKARFDEANNVNWARRLEQAGVHVVYGLVGLKTHTKVVLVVRQEGEHLRRYVHIGTGNYNSKTAKLYTDLSLLSCREDVGADLTDLFNYLTGYSRQQVYRQLLVAPVNLRDRMLALIQREIDQVQQGGRGQIIAKMNALVDAGMIQALYRASQAGVEIDLIVRGICCLKPGIPGLSENIRVLSLVGRYLEHSRIFYFYNNNQSEVFIGSADWMPRNLDRRVEAVTPILEPELARHLKELLDLFLSDNRHAWELQADGSYLQRSPASAEVEKDAQTILMQLAQQQKV
uniref:Polyphosphate kinase n=1 Tax=Cyanothece sp. (strain PCC 7425 / ATCC 29141) TaxID=395961 RepID=B8HTB6_CYAP4